MPVSHSLRASILALSLALSGCSVGMALSGKPEPNLAACQVGASVHQIEAQLGPPTQVTDLPDGGRVCTYEYELGNQPSPGRAVAHGVMDVLTYGLWEVVGTPIESLTGAKYQMTVTYDKDGKAQQITSRKVSGN